jgi:hypothetical protein
MPCAFCQKLRSLFRKERQHIFIIARQHIDATRFAQSKGWTRNDWQYVTEAHQMLGLPRDRTTVYILPSAHYRRDICDLEMIAELYTVVEVPAEARLLQPKVPA